MHSDFYKWIFYDVISSATINFFKAVNMYIVVFLLMRGGSATHKLNKHTMSYEQQELVFNLLIWLLHISSSISFHCFKNAAKHFLFPEFLEMQMTIFFIRVCSLSLKFHIFDFFSRATEGNQGNRSALILLILKIICYSYFLWFSWSMINGSCKWIIFHLNPWKTN